MSTVSKETTVALVIIEIACIIAVIRNIYPAFMLAIPPLAYCTLWVILVNKFDNKKRDHERVKKPNS